ncbi:MAG: hypothetical protein E7259_08895 [Lachnospiraceae bacterium]|nr:hypothetical protein [Lachnospiraceae bacterium]
MEKGKSEQIIERLIDVVENGQSVPLSMGKVAINKDETILMLRELENIVNGELKMYREFNDRKGKIINDAKKEAEDIVYEAEQTASRIRVTKGMSSVGSGFKMERMDESDKMVLRTANDIYAASLIYTDEMLTEVNDVVAQAYEMINNQYGRMVQVLEEKAKLIADNKAELMASLKELSEDDRYAQILELGQLLSFELYNERMKLRQLETRNQIKAFEGETVDESVEGFEDSAFSEMQEKEEVTDSAFSEVSGKKEVTDSVFAEVPEKEEVTDSVFAEVSEKEEVTDSAFAEVPEKKEVADSVFAEVAATEVKSAEENLRPEDAVSRTLNMFKNYKPNK